MPPRKKVKTEDVPPDENDIPSSFPTPSRNDQALRMSYNIARGEQGVLTFEPYKSILLPHWRFRTVSIAKHSSQALKSAFDFYIQHEDFVGADMARKFIQMGMTRAKRYANHKGGRKYDRTEREVEAEGGKRTDLPKSEGHEGRDEKLAASEVFKVVWRECIEDEGYLALKAQFQKEKKEYGKGQSKVKKEEDTEEIKVKEEDDSEDIDNNMGSRPERKDSKKRSAG